MFYVFQKKKTIYLAWDGMESLNKSTVSITPMDVEFNGRKM
jgi:hypothetical protein